MAQTSSTRPRRPFRGNSDGQGNHSVRRRRHRSRPASRCASRPLSALGSRNAPTRSRVLAQVTSQCIQTVCPEVGFPRRGRSSLTRLHGLPVIALICSRHPVRSEELFETLAHFSVQSRELVDRFGLFLAIHDEAGELPNSYTATRERRLTY